MSVFLRGARWLLGFFGRYHDPHEDEVPASHRYRVKARYYEGTGLYDDGNEDAGPLRALRNPVHPVVSFHRAHLWPGKLPEALPIDAKREAIKPAVERVWEWSNWGANKQVAAGWYSLFGDMFVKVSQKDDGRPYLQLIEPERVTDLDHDERGFLTRLRIDTPKKSEEGGRVRRYWHVEVWSKESGDLKVYEHEAGECAAETDMGTPRTTPLAAFGIDFVPVVHAKFRDEGGKRGVGVFEPFLEVIDEANRSESRLSEMFFRYDRPVWALERTGTDASGRPLAAASLSDERSPATPSAERLYQTTRYGVSAAGPGEVELGKDAMLKLPGNTTVRALVPPVDYGAGQAIVEGHMDWLAQLMPEMLYSKIIEKGDVSGVALRRFMAPAVDRVIEARGSAEEALARAHAMALTMGQNAGLPEFRNIGSYENGDFEHSFEERDVLPETDAERAEALALKLTAYEQATRAGYSPEEAAKMAGLTEAPTGAPEREAGAIADPQALTVGLLTPNGSDGQNQNPAADR